METRLTDKDLAKRWGVTTRTLLNWRNSGKGPAYLEISGGTIRYREEDVIAFELKNLRGGDKEGGQ